MSLNLRAPQRFHYYIILKRKKMSIISGKKYFRSCLPIWIFKKYLLGEIYIRPLYLSNLLCFVFWIKQVDFIRIVIGINIYMELDGIKKKKVYSKTKRKIHFTLIFNKLYPWLASNLENYVNDLIFMYKLLYFLLFVSPHCPIIFDKKTTTNVQIFNIFFIIRIKFLWHSTPVW